MKEAHELAANRSRLSEMKGKKHHERKGHSPVLRPDSVRNVRERGRSAKLRSYWEEAIYRLIKRKGEESPFTKLNVEPESGEGLRRVIHRRLILPCNDLTFKGKTADPARRSKQKRKITRPAVCPPPARPQKSVQMKRLRVC